MSNASDLLRMLEPAVRPGGVPARGTFAVPGARSLPGPGIESQSFEAILDQAQSMADELSELTDVKTLRDTNEAAASDRVDRIAPLQGFDRISNASLRDMVASARANQHQ